MNLLQSSYNFDIEMSLDEETVIGDEFGDVAGDVQDDQLPGPSGYVPSNSDVQPTKTHTPTDTNPDNNTNTTDTDLRNIMLRVETQVSTLVKLAQGSASEGSSTPLRSTPLQLHHLWLFPRVVWLLYSCV